MLTEERRITARADVAFSPEARNVYLWVGEAF
jgi:hypothetical protein